MVDNGESLEFPAAMGVARVPGTEGGVDFSRLVADADAADLARRLAGEAAVDSQLQAESDAAEAEKRWYQERAERSAALEGTDPEEVFGEHGARLCQGFLEYMAERGFPGSRQLTGTRRLKVPIEGRSGVLGAILGAARTVLSELKLKGYELGYDGWAVNSSGSFAPASMGHRRRVYLCEDGRLRSGKHDRLLGDVGMDKRRGERLVVAMGNLEDVEVVIPCGCGGAADVQPHRCEDQRRIEEKFLSIDIEGRLLQIARDPQKRLSLRG